MINIPRFFMLLFSPVTGIAKVKIPSFFRILFDSEIKSLNGLKCWADSKAMILSAEFFWKR